MLWLMAITVVLFELLAVCVIGNMVASGFHIGLAVVGAVWVITIGAAVVKVMYESTITR